MIVRLAKENDYEHILKIWQACFTEDKAYIDNYLKYCLPYTKTWLLSLDGFSFVSCLSIIPSFVIIQNITHNGGYLYAVGTLPSHRGNSYSKTLMSSAINNCREEGFSYIIVKPADESLYSFYLKSKFDTVISKGLLTLKAPQAYTSLPRSISTTEISASELYDLRIKSFSDTNFLWCKEILNYALIEAKSRGGSCKKVHFLNSPPNSSLYYIAYPDDLNPKKIKVLETSAKNIFELDIIASLIKRDYPIVEDLMYEVSPKFKGSEGFLVTKSSLLLLLNSNISPFLESFHLSLPLE